MLQVLKNDPLHKANYVPLNDANSAVAAHWMRKGFDLALEQLESLGRFEAPPTEITETFEDDLYGNKHHDE